MTPLRAALPLLVLATLPACVLPVPVPEGTPGAFEIVLAEGDPCGAQRLQYFVGQEVAAAEATTFSTPVPIRILRPGQPVTADINPERLNFRSDAAGRIVAVDCG